MSEFISLPASLVLSLSVRDKTATRSSFHEPIYVTFSSASMPDEIARAIKPVLFTYIAFQFDSYREHFALNIFLFLCIFFHYYYFQYDLV